LQAATRLQPRLTTAWIELSVLEELRGNHAAARSAIENALRYDAGFQPRWAMANYLLRQNRMDEFWIWARRCVAVPYANQASLIRLCSRIDPAAAYSRLGPGGILFQRQFVDYLLSLPRAACGPDAALDVAGAGRLEDRRRLLDCCDRSLAAGDAKAALRIWNAMIQVRILPQAARSSDDLLTDSSFQRKRLGQGFDWRTYPSEGGDVITGSGLIVSLTGRQRDDTVFTEQHAAVTPGSTAHLEVETESIGTAGLSWVVYPLSDWSKPLGLVTPDAPGRSAVSVRIPPNVDLIRLTLLYRRLPGTMRGKGEVRFSSVRLKGLQP
jgi:hypothetical protein